jgi:DNA-binding FrmR family transcriptional regulator
MRGYTDNKKSYLRRLRRIEGQVRGLQNMIDEDRYCIVALTQIFAVTRALQEVAIGLLDEHLGHCVGDAIESGGAEANARVAEASAAVRGWCAH